MAYLFKRHAKRIVWVQRRRRCLSITYYCLPLPIFYAQLTHYFPRYSDTSEQTYTSSYFDCQSICQHASYLPFANSPSTMEDSSPKHTLSRAKQVDNVPIPPPRRETSASLLLVSLSCDVSALLSSSVNLRRFLTLTQNRNATDSDPSATRDLWSQSTLDVSDAAHVARLHHIDNIRAALRKLQQQMSDAPTYSPACHSQDKAQLEPSTSPLPSTTPAHAPSSDNDPRAATHIGPPTTRPAASRTSSQSAASETTHAPLIPSTSPPQTHPILRTTRGAVFLLLHLTLLHAALSSRPSALPLAIAAYFLLLSYITRVARPGGETWPATTSALFAQLLRDALTVVAPIAGACAARDACAASGCQELVCVGRACVPMAAGMLAVEGAAYAWLGARLWAFWRDEEVAVERLVLGLGAAAGEEER